MQRKIEELQKELEEFKKGGIWIKVSKREKFLQDALNLNHVQASILSQTIKEIPDDKLSGFLTFRAKFIEPMRSNELITQMALNEYSKLLKLAEIRTKNPKLQIQGIKEVKEFIFKHFRGKNIGNGLGVYAKDIIIGMNEKGELINKDRVDDYNNFLKISATDSEKIYNYLSLNQHLIGVVKAYTRKEVPAIEAIEPKHNGSHIDKDVTKLLNVKTM